MQPTLLKIYLVSGIVISCRFIWTFKSQKRTQSLCLLLDQPSFQTHFHYVQKRKLLNNFIWGVACPVRIHIVLGVATVANLIFKNLIVQHAGLIK